MPFILVFSCSFSKLCFCQHQNKLQTVYFISQTLASFKTRKVSCLGPGFPYTTGWQSWGAATPVERRSTCPPTPLTTHSLACPCNLRPEQSSLGGWQGAWSIPVPELRGDFPVLQMSWRLQKSNRARNDRHKKHLHGNHLRQHSGSKRKGGGLRECQLREMVPEDQVGAPSPGPGKSSEKGKSQPQIVWGQVSTSWWCVSHTWIFEHDRREMKLSCSHISAGGRWPGWWQRQTDARALLGTWHHRRLYGECCPLNVYESCFLKTPAGLQSTGRG